MPARSKDLAALRTFAHAKAASPRPNAWCHCGSTGCEAHPDTRTQCAGAVTLILRHDPTMGRVWNIEEVCAACAPLLTHTTVGARAARPGRASEQLPAPVPAARRSRRSAQRPKRRSSGQQR
ncbi:hypothetical protein [Streptomyces sp. NPDC015414]|uniref:hypothetical protein n=1 Tax=Streptomyces sp. NPDC015414 TaxID=3364957 RepID=UPI0036F73261